MQKVYVPEPLLGELDAWCDGITLAAGQPICWRSDDIGSYVEAPDAIWAASLSALFADSLPFRPD